MDTIKKIEERIKFYPDYPVKGVNFIDLLPLLSDSETFGALVGELNEIISTHNIAAPEARGFLFGAPLLLLGKVKNLVAFRKSGKLPAADGDLRRIAIVKEYGHDNLFYRLSDMARSRPTGNIIEITIFDDILATGGTAEGMALSLNGMKIATPDGEMEVRVREFVFLAAIVELKGRERLEPIAPVRSLINY